VSGEVRRLGAIDIGTVTTRLLIADVSPGVVSEVVRRTDITHLGEDLAASGMLSQAAMHRVAEVVSGYRSLLDEHAIESVVAVATSASRDAHNGHQFIELLARAGVRPDIISGQQEARLCFVGATFGLSATGVLVDDIGGGSTELVFGSAGQGATGIRRARSIDVGSRRLTELYLSADPPAPGGLGRARAHVAREFEGFFNGWAHEVGLVVSVAGTATSLVAVHLALETYDAARVHGFSLSREVVAGLLDMLAAMPLAERARITGLHPGRAGVIVAGALILDVLLDVLEKDSTLVSERDILYGILLEAYENTDARAARAPVR
jgi:exopolyphosphatase/guanosine-5'-triphosphate,3'-diphosphate pyrophosphatase